MNDRVLISVSLQTASSLHSCRAKVSPLLLRGSLGLLLGAPLLLLGAPPLLCGAPHDYGLA